MEDLHVNVPSPYEVGTGDDLERQHHGLVLRLDCKFAAIAMMNYRDSNGILAAEAERYTEGLGGN